MSIFSRAISVYIIQGLDDQYLVRVATPNLVETVAHFATREAAKRYVVELQKQQIFPPDCKILED